MLAAREMALSLVDITMILVIAYGVIGALILIVIFIYVMRPIYKNDKKAEKLAKGKR